MRTIPQKEFEYDTLWLLRMIESELIDNPKNNRINFPFNNPKVMFSETGEAPSADRQRAVINYLENKKVLKLKTNPRHVVYMLSSPPTPLTTAEKHDPLYNFKN